MKSSKILDFLFGYEQTDRNFKSSRLSGLGKSFTDNMIGGMGSAYAKKILKNPISEFISGLFRDLASASLRIYGVAVMTFGLMTLLINFADYYFRALPTSPAVQLIIGVVFAVIAIPLIFIDTPMVEFFERHTVTDVLFFEIFCLRRPRRNTETKSFPPALEWIVPITFGTVIAVLGFIFPINTVLIAVGALIFAALAFSSPEFSFLATVFCIPVMPLLPHSSLVLCCLIGVTLVSFLAKVVLGKRLLHFELYDALIMVYITFALISGIFNKGMDSFESSLILVALTLSYFLASNIVVNKRIADNTVNLMIVSSVPTAIYGIIARHYLPYDPQWIDSNSNYGCDVLARAYSTFGNPNIYAVFLIAALIFSIAFMLDSKRRRFTPFYFISAALNGWALLLTFTRGAWIAVVLALLGLILIRSRRAPKLLLVPAAAIPLGLCFIPSQYIDRFLSSFAIIDTSASYRLSIWRSSLRMFKDRIFIGVGVGEKAFNEEFMKYAEEGVMAPHHSHNLFLEIGCQLGIFALVLFVFLLFTRVRHRATYSLYVRESGVSSACTAAGVVTFALLAFGMTDYIWYSSPMCFLFWTVFGLGSATLRIAKADHDERYLSETSDSSAYEAATNIFIDSKFE